MISKSLKFTDLHGNDLYLAFDLDFESMEKSRYETAQTAINMANGRQYLVTEDMSTVKARFDKAAAENEAHGKHTENT